jgi:hypothetical protein
MTEILLWPHLLSCVGDPSYATKSTEVLKIIEKLPGFGIFPHQGNLSHISNESNVTMMLSRSPTFPPQEIDGDLDI